MMLNITELLAIRNENETREPSQERDTIAALLQHIQDVHDQTHLRYRVAYEVFCMDRSVSYKNREVKAICWSRDDANAIKDTARRFLHVSVIHVIKIDGKWYRVSVTPLDKIIGDPETAKLSRIDPNLLKENKNETA